MPNASPILVVGKSGQLGRCLLEAGCRRGLRVSAAGRPDFDILHPETFDGALADFAPSVIVNAAAYTAVDKAESEPKQCFAVNRDGVRQLAAAAWQRNVPFIHISTDYVFDGQNPSPYCESDSTAPLGVYGRSKLAGEKDVRAVHPDAVILRTSWLYSAFGSNFLTTMLRLAKSQPVVRVVDDQHGCPTSAHDLADAVLDISVKVAERRAARPPGIYHLSGAGRTTWHGLAAEIFASVKARGQQAPDLVPITTADYPTRAQRPQNSVLDCAKAEREFGVRLPPWQASVSACVDRLVCRELQ